MSTRRTTRLGQAVLIAFLVLVLVVALLATTTRARAAEALPPMSASEAPSPNTSPHPPRVLSPTRFLNAGNAYARRGEIGRAVLAYERGLLLDPRDRDLGANLDAVRREAGLAPPVVDVSDWAASMLSANAWTSIAFGGLLLLGLLLGYRGLVPVLRRHGTRAPEPTRRVAVATVSALLLFVLVAGAGAFLALPDPRRAVVVDEPVTLRISPFDAAAAVGTLPEGSTVRIERRHGEHVYVVDGDEGAAGWAPRESLERLLPG